MKLEEIFQEEEDREERENRIRQLEDEIEKDMSIHELRRFREKRHLLISGPEAGPGQYTYSDCRAAREAESAGLYAATLDDYRLELEEQRRRAAGDWHGVEPEEIAHYRSRREG